MNSPDIPKTLEINETFLKAEAIHVLQCGDKILEVTTPTDECREVITIINTTELPAIPGATTALYKRACEILFNTAEESGKPFVYTFGTQNPRMRSWAKKYGAAIFNWSVHQDDNEGFIAQRTF
ncbi:hypothetical protein BH09PAT3_BH09PAT3_6270 [soil metagenome]